MDDDYSEIEEPELVKYNRRRMTKEGLPYSLTKEDLAEEFPFLLVKHESFEVFEDY